VAPGARSPGLTWESLVAARPDVVIVAPCGFALDRTRGELAALTARPEWEALPAVRNGRAYAVDGNAYVSRPGPRLIDSAELLAGLIQPGFCASLMPANGWERI
jgi:iron complex transport system substrate-binding protein